MVLLKTAAPKVFAFMSFILIAHFTLLAHEARAEEKVYRIRIEGMHCSMCIHRVTTSLKKLKQVKDVEVDLDNGTAAVTLNDGEDLAVIDMEEAVKDSGYNPTGIEAIRTHDNSPDKAGKVGDNVKSFMKNGKEK